MTTTFLQKLKHINWTIPIVRQWPLMLFYIILIGWVSVTKNPFPRWMIIFLHAYMAAWVVDFSRSNIVKTVVYLFIYTLFLTELVLSWLFGMHISPAVLVLVLETTGRESQEFLGMLPDKPDFWPMTVLVILLLTLNIATEWGRRHINKMLENRVKTLRTLRYIGILFLVVGIVFSTISYTKLLGCKEMNEIDEWRSHMRNPGDAVTMLMVSAWDVYLSGKEIERATEEVEHIETVAQEQPSDSITLILVIGESYIRNHAALYGYPLPTTPFLSAEKEAGRLFAFNDAVTPYNQTTKVIRNMLSCNSLGDEEHWASRPPLTAVFKKNGYWVSMQDNQKTANIADVFGFSLNTYLYHPAMAAACYDEMNETVTEYDGDLVETYRQHHQRPTSAQQLLVFHLMGQHESFEHRYPHNDKRFELFTADSIRHRSEEWLTTEMRQMIAHYDNATRYNDYVLEQITKLSKDKQTVVVYTADHGEEVYDYRPSYGRDSWELGGNPEQVLRYQYRVPLVVWCSEKYKAQHPDIIGRLKASTNRPLMIDNICHLMFRLISLKTPYYQRRRDVLSDDYHCPPRLINDKVIFDSIMKP